MIYSPEDFEDLESLIIFDQICPLAVDHLPVMSRRVFDVGLDMSRMRHSLKAHRRSKSNRIPTDGDNGSGGYLNGSTDQGQRTIEPPSTEDKSEVPQRPRQRLDNSRPGGKSFSPLTSNPHTGFSPLSDGTQSSPQDQDHITAEQQSDDDAQNFDLKPPPPNKKVKHIDSLSERLFSNDHLDIILEDPTFLLRFTAFLSRYKPRLNLLLMRYLEAQKVYRAVEYANALSETTNALPDGNEKFGSAATFNVEFEDKVQRSFNALVSEALPAYINSSLSKVVTEYMVREITGTSLPVMRELVGGLAEVFCLADPNQQDCPIVYASEEFYRTTRYTRDDVIGRNCRFLQGPKSDRASIGRLSSSIKAGQECCELILNYRRDGSPFMNLLLIAPLYDNRGSIKYFIGAQVDVSGLVEDGRGLESFERLLHQPQSKSTPTDGQEQKHLRALSELSQLLSVDEASVMTQNLGDHVSNNNDKVYDKYNNVSNTNSSTRSPAQSRHRQQWSSSSSAQVRRPRVVLGADDDEDDDEDTSHRPPSSSNRPAEASRAQSASKAWTLSSSLSSGRLPGVYQNYLLVRPHPKMRIIFVSPSLRIPGLLQSPLLSHVLGPESVKQGISEAFQAGAAVTAKVIWTTAADADGGNVEGKPRYIQCTPLLGSDDEVGVWMVVMVEKGAAVTGSLARGERMGRGWAPLRNGAGVDGEMAGEDYASYMRNSGNMQGTPTPSRGMDSVDGGGGTDGKMNGKIQGATNGMDMENRIEEVFTPGEEKAQMH